MNPRRTRGTITRAAVALAVFATSISFIFAADAPEAEAGPPPVLFAYVPLPADDYQTALFTINAAAGTSMQERIGITIAAPGAIVYYDHWEDGFETDIANPTQGSTQIWGDGITTNGDATPYCVSGCTGDTFAEGAVLQFQNTIPTPRSNTILFDGSDKVASTRGFTVTKAGWGQAGPLHAGSVAAFDTSRFGTFFRVPVGEDTVGGAISNNPFNYSGISVMASRPNTFVQVDTDADGTYDLSGTINEGETFFVNGGLSQGARVAASQPVQAHLLTGDRTATYEDRWFELFPVAVWDNSYFAAAVTSTGSGSTDQTELWVYNEKSTSIDVDVRGPSGILATLTIGANAVARYTPPANTAVELTSSDGAFYALGAIGTGSPSGSSTHDWGYTLVPTSVLTPSVVIGWAPGNSSSPPTANYSAVWVAGTAATTVYVDYDADGTPDTSFASSAYASTPVTDPNDNDMSGARIYTTDGTTITAAYGQNPAAAPPGGTALDLGITVVPSTALVVTKDVILSNDVAGDGLINPGDTIQWDITVSDAGALALTNVVVSDAIPTNTTYVPGSSIADTGSGPFAIPDDTAPPAATVFPLDEGGYTLGTITPGATFTVRFETTVDDPFPAGVERVTNVVQVTSSQTNASAAADAPVFVPSLSITKTSSTGGAPLSPGDTYSYDIVVTNTGDTYNTNVVVTDTLPAGITWLGTSVDAPTTVSTTTWFDDFEGPTWGGGTGPWVAPWGEINDNTDPDSGRVQIDPDAGSRRLHFDTASRGAYRALGDLSIYDYVELSFDYRRQSFDSDFEWLQVDVSPNNGNATSGTWNPLTRFEGPANDIDYSSASLPITSLVNTTPGDISVVRFASSPSMTTDDDAWVDNVRIDGLIRANSVFAGVEPTAGNGYTVTPAPLDLGPGEVATITINVQVDDPMTPFSPTLVNTALVTSDQQPIPDGGQVTDTVELIDLELDKVITTPAAIAGQDATFTLTLTNQGPTAATGIAVTDVLPADLVYVSDSASQGSYDSLSGLWTVGDLGIGASATLELTTTVLTNDPVTNTAEVTAADQMDADSTPANGDPTEDDQASVTLDIIEGADLELTKDITTPAAYVGEDVTFTITLTNQGYFPTTGVTVVDLLPAGLSYVSSAASQGTYVPGTGIWTVGNLAVSQTETLTLTATVTSDGTIVNSAQVTASGLPDPDSTPNNSVPAEDDQDSATVDVGYLVDLALTKAVDDATPRIGDAVTFTIDVANAGPSIATGVEVTDVLPAGLTYDSHTTSQGTYTDSTGLWDIGSMAAGGSATLTIDVLVTGDGTFPNTAEVTAANEPDADSTPDNGDASEDDQDTATVTVAPEADLSLTKVETSGPAFVGDTATFLVTILNSGPDSATGVQVSDVLPAGLTYVSDTASQGTYDDATGIWSVGTLANGASATIAITTTVDSPAPITNTAQVSASDQFDPDSTPGNSAPSEDDQDSASIDVDALADLEVFKTVDTATPDLGQTIRFTVTVANAGPETGTGIEVTDRLPVGLSYVTHSASQGTYDEPSGLWTVGTLPNGGSATLTIDAIVTGSSPGTNWAEITAASETDPDSTPGNNDPAEDDQDSATWDPSAVDLELTKAVDEAAPQRGSQVTFTLTLANQGPDAATGVEVVDALPAGLTYVSHVASQGTFVNGTGTWTVGSVGSGGSATLDITATVDTDNAVTNSAEVTAADQPDVDSTPDNDVAAEDDQDSSTVTPVPVIDLSLSKVETSSPVYVGDPASFVLAVVNAGPSAATGVEVSDLLPAGLTYVSDTPSQGTYDDATGIWSVGSVPAGDSAELTIVATIDVDTPITNVAEVSAADQFDGDSTPANGAPTEDDRDTVTIDVDPAADLELTKAVDVSTPDVGEDVTFTVTVLNRGPSPATGIEVTDLLPAGLTYVSDTPTQGTYDETTGAWLLGDLGVSATASIQIVATVTTATPVTNVAEITAVNEDDPDSTPDNDVLAEDDQDSVEIVGTLVDLRLSKTASATTVGVGSDVTWTLTVVNDGPSPATGVAVTDVLPAGASYTTHAASQGAFDSGSGIWTVGGLANGGSATLQITTTIVAAGDVTNTAEVTAADQPDVDSTPSNGDPTEDDQDSDTVTGLLIDLELTKTVDNPTALVDDDVTFTITVGNAGVSTATGVVVTDVLPGAFTFVSDAASQGTYDDTTGIWDVGTLTVGQTETLAITATVTTTGILTNVAEVIAADQPDSDSTPDNNDLTEDDQDAATVTPTPNADLELAKSVDDATPLRGGQVTFTIDVDNAGPNDATGVVVEDVLPAGLTFDAYTASQGSYDDTTGVWAVGDLAVGLTARLEITATVDTDSPAVNSAAVTAADQVDPDSTPDNDVPTEDDQDAVSITPEPVADLRLAKTADTVVPQIGDTVTFTIDVTNDGPSPAAGVSVSDTLPAGVTYASDTASQGTYDDATGSWDVGDLAVGQTETLLIRAVVDVDTVIVNVAEVSAATEFDPDSTPANGDASEDDYDTATLSPTPLIDLEVTKSVDVATPNVGSDVTFTVSVSNAGPSDATGIELTDLLPADLTYVSDSPSVGSYDETTGVWTVGDLNAGDTESLLITATVTTATAVNNVAQVTAADQVDADSTPDNDDPTEDDQDSVSVTGQLIDLEVTNTVDRPIVAPGDTVTFTVTVTNEGPSAATGVTLTDVLPPGVTYVSDTASGAFDPTTGVWTVGSLSPGGAASFQIVVTVDALGSHTAVAQVTTADQPDVDSTPGNDAPGEDDQADATVTATLADVSVTKTTSTGVIDLGSAVVFTITVTSEGPDDATGVVVGDDLPAGLLYQSAVPSQGVFDTITNQWTVGDLAVGQTETLLLTAAGTASGTYTNVAEVVAMDQQDADSTPDNGDASEDDQASATVQVVAVDLSLTKTVDTATPGIGSDVVFTVSVSNAGPDAASGVSVDDLLPTGLLYVSHVASMGAYDAATGTWSIGDLPVGTTGNLDITATVTTAEAVENVAQVATTDQIDIDSVPGNGVAAEDDQASASVDALSASLSGVVWVDTDEDGILDPGEELAEGVVVSLYDEGGILVGQVTTGADGSYRFDDLVPGTYTIELSDLPDDVMLGTYDPDGTADGRTTVEIVDGDNISDLDFGLMVVPATTTTTTSTTTTVPDTTTTTSSGGLPVTGSDLGGLALWGICMVLAGAFIAGSARRNSED
ncbi:MAG: SdrD B-like domain-containing protein [Acidimicrobiia bacterium]|nr:SdrD B-like domain-containing protein [Acidimicrobiia bacterium]